MSNLFSVGNVVSFTYNGKARHVKVEKHVKTAHQFGGHVNVVAFTGWDALADYPTGGYRCFSVEKVVNPQLVG